eukprot:GHVP01038714.1.p1 GENE.GHVP01038714.1~~GHVP01038714.1.p1  ORF type:complete len:147 (+),score=10.64 GHVP01038714.1:848-1288(+)
MPKLRTMKISSQTGAGQYTNHRTQGQIQLQPQSYRETNGSTASSSVDASESHQDTILGAKWNDFLKKVDSAKSLSLQNICTNIVIRFKDYQEIELCKIEVCVKITTKCVIYIMKMCHPLFPKLKTFILNNKFIVVTDINVLIFLNG